ncbi:MAG: amino acid permease [Labilithrix sp.]|nr:amino acid permease [Labilithrix sp.]
MTERAGEGGGGAEDLLPRVLTLRDATMLVVSSVIGVGIFLTPGDVAAHFPSVGGFFFAWLLGGALALAGALANAELGAMFPKAGGNYVYLTAAYHPMAGFLVGWLSFFGIFAGTVATLAIGFTISLSSLVPLTPAAKMAVAIAVIWIASAVNASATKTGAALNTSTAYLKIGAMVLLVVVGPLLGRDRAAPEAFVSEGGASFASFGVGLAPVLFSYLGWNASVFVAGEIESPGKNLPRSLFAGLGICTLIYVLVTTTYVYALGMRALPGMPVVGIQAGHALFGASGGPILAVVMMASIFGTVNANVLVGPRIAYAMATDGLFFRAAARLNAAKTPHVAVLGQAVVATVLVVAFEANIESLGGVLNYTTFAIVLATIADTTALYVLRRRQPDRDRPYRARGYPVVPLLYVLANVAIATSMIYGKPVECLTSVGVLLSGAPIYLLFARRRA